MPSPVPDHRATNTAMSDTHCTTRTSLRLDGELTIYRAVELCDLLKAALAADGAVDIDLDGVTEIDSAGVQLLMSARKTAHQAARDVRLVALSPAVHEVFALLGLTVDSASLSTPADESEPAKSGEIT
jgi:anti-sigma B factor antagonist